MERDRFEEVNEEDRDSRWRSGRVWWIMARTAKATVMVALGTLPSGFEGSNRARERSLAPSNSSGTVAAFMDLDTVVSTFLSPPSVLHLRPSSSSHQPTPTPWGLSYPRLIVIYLCPC